MTHRSICLPDFPAVSHVRRYSLRGWIEWRQIGRVRRVPIEEGQQLFENAVYFTDVLKQRCEPARCDDAAGRFGGNELGVLGVTLVTRRS